MAQHTSSLGELDPIAEQLLADGRSRKAASLVGRERATRWLLATGFVCVALGVATTGPEPSRASVPVFVLLLLSFALASRLEIEVGPGGTVPTELVLVPMLFLLPARTIPLAVALGLVLGQLPSYVRGSSPISRIPVVIGNAWYAVGPALVMAAFHDPPATPSAAGVLVLALLAQYAGDFATSVGREWFSLRIAPRQLVPPLLWVFMIDMLLAPVGFAASVASRADVALAFLPLPLFLLIWLFARERTQRLDQTLELSNAYRGTAFLLGDVVEADDAYTGSHSRQVVDLVLAVGEELRLDPRSRRRAEFAALLHDVGKIKIPGEIINKPGPLTPEERAVINTHTIEGEQLLLRVGGLLGEVGTIVRSCHEDYDGGGYPDGLAGDGIPLIARIVSACDAYNAMTTDRSYRKARAPQAALAELEACAGTQFDPRVVGAIGRVVARGHDSA